MTFSAKSINNWLRGSFTALVTPFSGGKVDFDAYARLIERQIDAGTHGLVAVGTTGETSTLGLEEHVAVAKAAVEVADGRVPVISGVGSNDTATSITLAEAVVAAGADGVLAVTGYYNKPSQSGLIAHFSMLADAIEAPIIVYNVPARTSCDITVETLGVLSTNRHIVGVKDASGNLARVARQRLACTEGFLQLSGEDLTAVGFNAMGGLGCISVTSNVAPELCAQMQSACLEGRWDEALALQDRLAPLHDALFADASPAPTKYALARLGLIEEELRLPNVPASEAAKVQVDRALAGLGMM